MARKVQPPALMSREARRRLLFAPIATRYIGSKAWGGNITVTEQFTHNRSGYSWEEQSWSRRNPRFDGEND